MKKVLSFMMVLVLSVFLLMGCQARTENATPERTTYKIAYIARAQGDSFAAWLANAVEEEAEKYPDIMLTVYDGESRNEVIASHIENAVINEYDLILLQPLDSEAQVAPVTEAMNAGVKVVTVNNRINDNDRAPAIDADPVEQAARNARLAVEQVPENGRVVVLMGPAGNMHSDQRRIGWQKEFFDKRTDVTILGEQIANWNKDEAMRFMEDWIVAFGRVDAVISMNDNMAAGAIEAIQAAGLNDILVYGVDGTAEAAMLIQEGLMTSTTFQNAYLLAETALRLSHDLLTGSVEHDIIMIDCPLYTKDNVEELIEIHRKAGNIE